MGLSDEHTKEIEAYDESPFQDLTVNDALILITVCAANEENQVDDEKRIAELAKKHPIFSDIEDSIYPAINRYMNMLETATDLLSPATSAANILKTAEKVFEQELKEIALAWIGKILIPDGILSAERKRIIDHYALLLNIDNTAAQQIMMAVSDISKEKNRRE